MFKDVIIKLNCLDEAVASCTGSISMCVCVCVCVCVYYRYKDVSLCSNTQRSENSGGIHIRISFIMYDSVIVFR